MFSLVRVDLDDQGKEHHTIMINFATRQEAEAVLKNYIGKQRMEIIEQ